MRERPLWLELGVPAVSVLAALAGCTGATPSAPRDGALEDVAGAESSARDAADASFEAGAAEASAAGDSAVTDTLELLLFSTPENTPPGALYVAGSFNEWAPGDARYALAPRGDGVLSVRLAGLAPGALVEFKFTRGAWSTVERLRDGTDRPNRALRFDPAHPVAALFVERWADLAAPAHTRSARVQLLAEVPIPQLGRTRNVWVYLPPDYDRSAERYRVLYLYDGQNAFDAGTSAFGDEWQLDEALDALFYEGRVPGVLAVAPENSALRPCEYNVFPSDPHPACADGSAQGDALNRFYAETLKPRIDAAYRTRADRDSTAVLGSSMGGSMALRLGFTHLELFSRVAALSPSVQNTLAATPAMPAFLRAQRPTTPTRVYLDLGAAETIRDLGNDVLTRNLYALRDALAAAGLPADALRTELVPGAVHNERAWAARAPDVLQWLWR